MNALDFYHRFVLLIDKACEARDIFAVPKAAEEAEMNGGEEQRGMGQRWNYSHTDETGQIVIVHARWWDQSQAFSIQPDMHVMSVELKAKTTLMKHERRYES